MECDYLSDGNQAYRNAAVAGCEVKSRHPLGMGALVGQLQQVDIWICSAVCSGCEVKSRHAFGMKVLVGGLQHVAIWRCSGCQGKSHHALGMNKLAKRGCRRWQFGGAAVVARSRAVMPLG